eukprot:765481-Hanusia_phi.AAC.1
MGADEDRDEQDEQLDSHGPRGAGADLGRQFLPLDDRVSTPSRLPPSSPPPPPWPLPRRSSPHTLPCGNYAAAGGAAGADAPPRSPPRVPGSQRLPPQLRRLRHRPSSSYPPPHVPHAAGGS